jgi:hypothetical protein
VTYEQWFSKPETLQKIRKIEEQLNWYQYMDLAAYTNPGPIKRGSRFILWFYGTRDQTAGCLNAVQSTCVPE